MAKWAASCLSRFTLMDATQQKLERALEVIKAHRADAGDGQWLEALTRDIAPHILEWEIEQAWAWADWPDRVATLGEESRPNDDSRPVSQTRF